MHRNVNSSSINDCRLSRILEAIQTLMAHVPALEDALAYDPELPKLPTTLPEWNALNSKVKNATAAEGAPVLIATLYGPTGSGKSTCFRILTGVDVPSGETRPQTRACAVAVPPNVFDDRRKIHSLFPDYDIRELERKEDLVRKPTGARDPLFYTEAKENSIAVASHSLILVDVPDFDTIEDANKARAERMLAHAHLVVFIAQTEKYADSVVFAALERCCRLAGSLVYIFTKLEDPANAPRFREDLLVNKVASDTRFQSRRSDGRTLMEFLKESPMYAIRRSSKGVTIDDILPINDQGWRI